MECKICRSKTKLLNGFYHCLNCNFIMKKNIVSEEAEKNRYLLHKEGEDYFKYLHNLFKDYLKKDDIILDFGSGKSNALAQSFPKYNITSYDYYFNQVAYDDKKYDVIILNEVIEHIEYPLEVLENLRKMLKEEGFILIQTGLTDKIEDINKWWYTRDITHISFFSLNTFSYIAQKLNLNLIKKAQFIILRNKYS